LAVWLYISLAGAGVALCMDTEVVNALYSS